MPSIERTAYPRFKKTFTDSELEQIFQPDEEELTFARKETRKANYYFTLMALLKCQQYLGYFPLVGIIPQQVQDYLRNQLGILPVVELLDATDDSNKKPFFLFRQTIRSFLDIKPFNQGGQEFASAQIEKSAYTMSDPADLINVAIEVLVQQRYELPAFSTLKRLVGHLRESVHEKIYTQLTSSLTQEQSQRLDALLEVQADERLTEFTQLKATPGKASLKEMNLWAAHLVWLLSIIETEPLLRGIAHTKIRQFASEASTLEAGDLKDISNDAKRYSFLLCLIHQSQVQTRDQLVNMLLKRMRRTHNSGRDELGLLQQQYREIEEKIMAAASKIAHNAITEPHDEPFGKQTREVLDAYGGAQQLLEQYTLVGAYHNKNYLPLLWNIHSPHRAALFRLTGLLNIQASTQDDSLITALYFIQLHQQTRRDFLPLGIDLGFASERWQAFVKGKDKEGKVVLKRRELEICIFSHVADGLRCGDLFVPDSEEYADYRQQLLSWMECLAYLPAYCSELGLPKTAGEFVAHLRLKLSEVSHRVDKAYPGNQDLSIDKDGTPHLKRIEANPLPEGTEKFKEKLRTRMPERHLLDVLKDVQHWLNYSRHFHPASGSEPKMPDAVFRYLLTIFGYGCNLGPTQTARHVTGEISYRILKRINDQHISTEKLEAALQDIINEYTHFELPTLWGSGEAAIADGTHIQLRENNLLGERHIRYGGYGGIAYYHISDTYIALFSHFIACGVWEAVYIFDGLLKNMSDLQPDTIYADTHGQSEPAFGLAYLLGIELMPRMRTWDDVIFYRPDKQTTYQHIDALFTETVDWELLEKHWEDLMQVVISIHAGKVLPSMLLQKLGVYSRKNKLYRAFRELGRVVRTLFLLEYIDNRSLRQKIRAETTKVESFNAFCDWLSFGGHTLTSGDPVEQEKRVKYMNLVANVLMLRNVVDMTEVLNGMHIEGNSPTPEMIRHLSPYMTEHIKRFGHYILNMAEEPEPLSQEKFVLKRKDF